MKTVLIDKWRITVKFWNMGSVCGSISSKPYDEEPRHKDLVEYAEEVDKGGFAMRFARTLHVEHYYDIKTHS